MHGALHTHLCRASEDIERNSNDRCMFEGLATKLSGDCKNKMGLILDALEELKDLSESLHSGDITLLRLRGRLMFFWPENTKLDHTRDRLLKMLNMG